MSTGQWISTIHLYHPVQVSVALWARPEFPLKLRVVMWTGHPAHYNQLAIFRNYTLPITQLNEIFPKKELKA
jgi:hypothetical protein